MAEAIIMIRQGWVMPELYESPSGLERSNTTALSGVVRTCVCVCCPYMVPLDSPMHLISLDRRAVLLLAAPRLVTYVSHSFSLELHPRPQLPPDAIATPQFDSWSSVSLHVPYLSACSVMQAPV